jgi:TPR repeat protein
VRTRANANEIPAMEEIARRLIQGIGVAKDPQAGAGWLLRAAGAGSAQAAFNVGVMYERGFVVERDSGRAVDWYRKAADGDMPAAKHNLALLLRDGRGAPRDAKRAIELLHSAARQGMAASMFSLGDMYERGDAAPRTRQRRSPGSPSPPNSNARSITAKTRSWQEPPISVHRPCSAC